MKVQKPYVKQGIISTKSKPQKKVETKNSQLDLPLPKAEDLQSPSIFPKDRYLAGKASLDQSIQEWLQKLNRLPSTLEQRQIDFLEQIQQKIFEAINNIKTELLVQVIQDSSPPLCVECSILALQTLFSNVPTQDEATWNQAQTALEGCESEFLLCLSKFQELTVSNLFERQNLIRAKNHLIRYIVEDQISGQQIDRVNYKKVELLVQLAENIIGFIEVHDTLIKSFHLDSQRQFQKKQANDKIQLSQIDESNNEHSKLDEKPLDLKPELPPQSKLILKVEIPDQTRKLHKIDYKPQKSKTQTNTNNYLKSPSDKNNSNNTQGHLKQRLFSPQQKNYHTTKKTQQQLSSLTESVTQTSKKITQPNRPTNTNKPSDINLQFYQTQPQIIQKETLSDTSLNSPLKVPSQSRQRDSLKNSVEGTLKIEEIHDKLKKSNEEVTIENSNIDKLYEIINKNKINIKKLMAEQMDLKWKLISETEQLQIHVKQLQDQQDEQEEVKTNDDILLGNQKSKEIIPTRQVQKQVQHNSKGQVKMPTKVKRINENKSIEHEIQDVSALRKELTSNEQDRVSLEDELNKLLSIIDKNTQTIVPQKQKPKKKR